MSLQFPDPLPALRLGSRALTLLGLLALAAFLLARPINLTNSDIGRHLKNGETIVRTWSVPQTNLYSYTHPDFPVIDHHWGSGVLFYGVERIAGFTGLSIFFIALNLAAFLCFFAVAWRASSFSVAATFSPLALVLLSNRPEIRPEGFTLLLSGMFLLLLTEHRRGTVSPKTLLIVLPLLALLWVNLHIYFFLGPVLIGTFWIEEIIQKKLHHSPFLILNSQFATLALTGIVILINPAGFTGATQPFTLFGNFGYRLAENQSIPFLENYFGGYPPGLPYKIVLGVLIATWIAVAVECARTRRLPSLATLLLSVFFAVIGWLAIRNVGLSGLFLLALIGAALGSLRLPASVATPWKKIEWLATPLLAAAVIAGLFFLQESLWRSQISERGVGLKPGNLAAAQFLEREGVRGPIFNNYDIGGYLIYALFPREGVFVDNRPEAYPAAFFEQTLVPMQEDDAEWSRQDAILGFNAIVFYRQDLTEWGQGFLIRRVSDPAWAPVFVDGDTLIFLRRGGPNDGTIKKFALPKSMFTVRS